MRFGNELLFQIQVVQVIERHMVSVTPEYYQTVIIYETSVSISSQRSFALDLAA